MLLCKCILKIQLPIINAAVTTTLNQGNRFCCITAQVAFHHHSGLLANYIYEVLIHPSAYLRNHHHDKVTVLHFIIRNLALRVEDFPPVNEH